MKPFKLLTAVIAATLILPAVTAFADESGRTVENISLSSVSTFIKADDTDIPFDKWCAEADRLLKTDEVQKRIAEEIQYEYSYYGFYHDFKELSVSRSFQLPRYDPETGSLTDEWRKNLTPSAYCFVYSGDVPVGFFRFEFTELKNSFEPQLSKCLMYYPIDNLGKTVKNKVSVFDSYVMPESSDIGYGIDCILRNNKAYPVYVYPQEKYGFNGLKECVDSIKVDKKQLKAYDFPTSDEIMFSFSIDPHPFEEGVYTIQSEGRYLTYKGGKFSVSSDISDTCQRFVIKRAENGNYTISPESAPKVRLRIKGNDKFSIDQVIREYIITDDNGNRSGDDYFRIYAGKGMAMSANGNKIVFTQKFGYENADWVLNKVD